MQSYQRMVKLKDSNEVNSTSTENFESNNDNEYGLEEISNIYELWATVLHLLGVDHDKLTYHYSGRDLRLTDVHGKVWHDILA